MSTVNSAINGTVVVIMMAVVVKGTSSFFIFCNTVVAFIQRHRAGRQAGRRPVDDGGEVAIVTRGKPPCRLSNKTKPLVGLPSCLAR